MSRLRQSISRKTIRKKSEQVADLFRSFWNSGGYHYYVVPLWHILWSTTYLRLLVLAAALFAVAP